MMSSLRTQQGDILIFHGHSWISLAIQFFMNAWRWINFDFKPFYKHSVPNHVAMGDTNNNIIEARAEGVFICPLDHYAKDGGRVIIKVYRYPWDDKQIREINKYYGKYEGTPYQYVNFLQYIIYICTFKLLWLGKKREASDKKLYCSELAARIIYFVTRMELAKSNQDNDTHMYFRDYWKISPYVLNRWCECNCELITTYDVNNGVVTEI